MASLGTSATSSALCWCWHLGRAAFDAGVRLRAFLLPTAFSARPPRREGMPRGRQLPGWRLVGLREF